MAPKTDFEKELTGLLNKFSCENASDTPDFILARYLHNCLLAWDEAMQRRETWYRQNSKMGRRQ